MRIHVQRGGVGAFTPLFALICGIALGEQNSPVSASDAPKTEALAAQPLDAYLAACVQQQHFSGAALVARAGKILLSKGYGLADRENDMPCTPHSKFRIGSITRKANTATRITFFSA